MPQGVVGQWMKDNGDPACSKGYGYGALKSDGSDCKNSFVYRSGVIDANSSESWTEDLYKANDKIDGCLNNKYYVPFS